MAEDRPEVSSIKLTPADEKFLEQQFYLRRKIAEVFRITTFELGPIILQKEAPHGKKEE